MARLVETSGRSNAMNSYGRSPNNAPSMRAERKIQIVKAYGALNSTGVCPDGSVCTPSVPPAEVEFTINIFRRGNDYEGEVYIVSYDTRMKVNSNELIYYQDHEENYILCIFYVQAINGCNYELIIHMTPRSCANSGTMYAYVAPIYSAGFNVGGVLSSGEISLCECPRCNHLGPTFTAPMPCECSSPSENSCACNQDGECCNGR